MAVAMGRRGTPPPEGAMHESSDGFPLGMLGIANLGCTCYINSVVQVLLHAPGFRDFFLGGGHRDVCCNETDCFVCELDDVFQKAYSGARKPVAPADLLQSIWRLEPEFADGGMHDAHDFWMLALEALRKSEGGSRLVDSVFGGKLRTTTTCSTCGNTSSTVDQVIDLSLPLHRQVFDMPRVSESSNCQTSATVAKKDEECHSAEELSTDAARSVGDAPTCLSAPAAVPPPPPPQGKRRAGVLPRCGECETCKNPRLKKGCLRNKKLRRMADHSVLFSDCWGRCPPTPSDVFDEDTTLLKCLSDYMEPETLKDWMCEKCGELQQAQKTTSVEEFPLFLCIHLKRFDYNSGTGLSRKLDMRVEAPHELETSSLGVCGGRGGDSCLPDQTYRLRGIVAHDGSLNGGHYWCYMKQGTTWWKFNDQLVTVASAAEVNACEAYMLFYVID
eukprot:evm.model.scf_1362.2 EVM.evm.TU.scf_1362.2   scf_1362:27344-39694(+)